jgi:hypothetical protein
MSNFFGGAWAVCWKGANTIFITNTAGRRVVCSCKGASIQTALPSKCRAGGGHGRRMKRPPAASFLTLSNRGRGQAVGAVL